MAKQHKLSKRKFRRYGRFCDCGKYHRPYTKTNRACLFCKNARARVTYFNKFPDGLKPTGDELYVFSTMLNIGYFNKDHVLVKYLDREKYKPIWEETREIIET